MSYRYLFHEAAQKDYEDALYWYMERSEKKYPYTIIYSIESDRQVVIISSIYHHKRNPKKRYRK